LAGADPRAPDDSGIYVCHTWVGDATMDGAINSDDYIAVDLGALLNLGNWWTGDFNYDGLVNGDDYILLDIGAQASNGAPLAALAGPLTPIPEPAVGSLAAVLVILQGRRWRQIEVKLRL
jgi:hypothetical protein